MKPDQDAGPSGAGEPPDAAHGLFGEHLPQARQYAHLLATEGARRGLIGPREAPRLWERHLVNCAGLAALIPAGAQVCDVGSGAGLPGLVLAIARPDLSVTLVEPLLRRTAFLEEAVRELGLSRVEVVRARAEDLDERHRFSVVTARAVAPLDRLLPWVWPLVDRRGVLLAMKGASAHAEVEASRQVLRRLGLAEPEVVELGVPGAATPTYAVRVPHR